MSTTMRAAGVAVAILTAFVAIEARELSLAERVAAQEAIERVYYGHRIGTSKPFEEAVPRRVIEHKVRTYLKQSAALEKYWHTPVTSEMLERELVRMSRGTRMPERLRQLFAALGDDPVLIQECLARATLVDRLTRNFYGFDGELHRAAREEAEDLRASLSSGTLDPWREHPLRTEMELVRGEEVSDGRQRSDGPGGGSPNGPQRLTVSPEEFDRRRARLLRVHGEAGRVDESRDAFVVRVILEEDDVHVRYAEYRVAKTPWDTWWSGVAPGLDDTGIASAASPRASIPDVIASRGGVFSDVPCFDDDTWDNVLLGHTPSPRVHHTAVWTGTEMIVWGGSGSGYLNSGGRYDPATDSWTSTSYTDAPSPRQSHTAVWTGTEMIVWGGSGSGYLNSGGRYNPASDSWKATSLAVAPSGRQYHTAVWTGSTMIVWGGTGPTGLNSGGRYDPATDSWTGTSLAGAPSTRAHHTAVWTGSAMIVWGGRAGPFYDSGGSYDPATDSWKATSLHGAPSPRDYHTAVWTGSEMIVWGGFGLGDLTSGGRYDPVTNSWTATSTAGAPRARIGHTAVWTGSTMIVWGGYSSSYFYGFDSGGRYDPVADAWTGTSLVGAPAARFYHTAVWTGGTMIVWGGSYSPSEPLFSGGRYDPATDTWTNVSIDTPSPRSDHTTVWTGNLVLAWGGHGSDGGERYDPVTGTWTVISTIDSPSSRFDHTAVWTGSAMLVWGGTENTAGLYDGGRYDPLADLWTPISLVGAPTPRSRHTAVWTGTQMIVWGGFSGTVAPYPWAPFTDNVELQSGGRYDPATDTWSDVSLVNAPSPRQDHTAVWTGGYMVVWGGTADGFYFGDGKRYVPTANTWTSVSPANAPSPRAGHTAVWTGSSMLVWGGADDGSYFDTGGRYTPASDTWTSLSTASAPSPRTGHTAVWTGSSMLVWGGADDASYFNTGGRYSPLADAWTDMPTANAPSPRTDHTAVWTGSFMIAWGGYDGTTSLQSGGRYALGQSVDDDGDGYSECDGDCNDGDPTTHPGAEELCDGLDNNCSGTADETFADTDGDGSLDCADCAPADAGAFLPPAGVTCVFPDRTTFSWTPVPPAGTDTVYDVVRGVLGELPIGSGPSETCLESSLADTATLDAGAPGPGAVFWYLVRAHNVCGTGTYGIDSEGGERVTGACP